MPENLDGPFRPRIAVMTPSLLAGCSTLLLVWWIARGWFGAAAGIAAAALASLRDFHALYARTALTDVLLVFWLLLAVWLMERAYATRRNHYAVLAGVVTGLAWWTKYNGWLPLAFGLVALAMLLVFDAGQRRHGLKLVGAWATAAVLAMVVWSPFLYSLQPSGGYAVVAANHRQ